MEAKLGAVSLQVFVLNEFLKREEAKVDVGFTASLACLL